MVTSEDQTCWIYQMFLTLISYPWALKANWKAEATRSRCVFILDNDCVCSFQLCHLRMTKLKQTYNGCARVTLLRCSPWLKDFLFNPQVWRAIVGGESANSSWTKCLIPSCGQQIKLEFYWATSRCECEPGAGRFLLLLEPALTQTLWTQWPSHYNTKYNGKQTASN